MTTVQSEPSLLDGLRAGGATLRACGIEGPAVDRLWVELALVALDGIVPDWLPPASAQRSTDVVRRMPARHVKAWLESGELAARFEQHLAERDIGQANGRRNAGAYFTPPDLVELVVERTLAPVLAQATSAADVLSLRVLDPAVGTGVFLVETGRQLSRHLVNLTGMPELEARASVVRSCLRGIDAHQVTALLAAAALGAFAGDPETGARAVRWADFVLPATWSEVRTGTAPPFVADTWGEDGRSDFDIVIGNPPWGAVKPVIREFLATAEPALLDAHGAELRARVREHPHHDRRWSAHADDVRTYARALRTSGWYAHQGRGDADLYRYFVERAHALLQRDGARLGFLLPSALLRADGAAPLRQLLFETGVVDELVDFINSKRLFEIHSMFRFIMLVWERGETRGIRRATFGVTSVQGASAGPNAVRMSPDFLARVGGGRLTVPDVRWPRDAALLERLYQSAPLMGDRARTRPLSFVRELDMTNDSSSFVRARPTTALDDLVPLYEGRMVHQFDDRAKRFHGGSGRKAMWSSQVIGPRTIEPQFYVPRKLAERVRPSRSRAGFCDVTGHANERTVLSTLIPAHAVAGNKVPTVRIGPDDDGGGDDHLLWTGIANSFVLDWVARRRIATSLNFFHLNQLPFPDLDASTGVGAAIAELARTLTTQVDEWDLAGLHRRARQRAELDALVARTFGLDLEDLVHVLTDFPLLDRHQPLLASGFPSTITRDLLLTSFAHLSTESIGDVRALGADVGAGPVNLEERVAVALQAGQIGYLPGEYAKQLWGRRSETR